MLANVAKKPVTTRAADEHALPGLVRLRGMTILLVMFFQFAKMKWASSVDSIFYKLTSNGWIGVDLFLFRQDFSSREFWLTPKALRITVAIFTTVAR